MSCYQQRASQKFHKQTDNILGFVFPPISSDEIDAMIGVELQTLRTKEALDQEVKIILETKLEYFLARGTPNDIKKANEIMQQMIHLQDSTVYSQADSQIGQDLQKFNDKLVLLEDLVKDADNFHAMLQNPTIGQMYNTCKDELPKLLNLANSNLSESLMTKLIGITERMFAMKTIVEGNQSTEQKEKQRNGHQLDLTPSLDNLTDALVFEDLPKVKNIGTMSSFHISQGNNNLMS